MDAEKSSEVAANKLPLSQQEKAIIELFETIQGLTSALEPVLTPLISSPEKPDVEKSVDGDSYSPVATKIASHTSDIRSARTRLVRLMNRLEC